MSQVTPSDRVIGSIFVILGVVVFLFIIVRWHELRAMKVIPVLKEVHTDTVIKYVPTPVRKQEKIVLKDVKVDHYIVNSVSNMSTGFYQFIGRDGTIYTLSFCPIGPGKDEPDFGKTNGKAVHFKELVFARLEREKPEECQIFISAIVDRKASW
jgi:hypothetical protein